MISLLVLVAGVIVLLLGLGRLRRGPHSRFFGINIAGTGARAAADQKSPDWIGLITALIGLVTALVGLVTALVSLHKG